MTENQLSYFIQKPLIIPYKLQNKNKNKNKKVLFPLYWYKNFNENLINKTIKIYCQI